MSGLRSSLFVFDINGVKCSSGGRTGIESVSWGQLFHVVSNRGHFCDSGETDVSEAIVAQEVQNGGCNRTIVDHGFKLHITHLKHKDHLSGGLCALLCEWLLKFLTPP